jgi:L-ribulose-5-phosphate 4-epimerase
LTWGNANGIDRARGSVATKPSGVLYEEMGVEDIVVVDLAGCSVEDARRPPPTSQPIFSSIAPSGMTGPQRLSR